METSETKQKGSQLGSFLACVGGKNLSPSGHKINLRYNNEDLFFSCS